MTVGTSWWRHAVVYEVYVRSFADSDGDGVGDLEGARRRLPHLAALGVDAVWLTPFYPSPQADGGYDVADHRDVDPLFGDLATFDALVADAHALGLRVLVDVVPNHTSTAHPWFRAALATGPGSPERARYVFRDGDRRPNDWESDFGGPAWSREPGGGQWYLHSFAPEQADLDWSHPDVRAEYVDVLRFWLDRGVDGFRIDVAHGLVKHASYADNGPLPPPPPGVYLPRGLQWDQPGVHEVYREWRKVLDSYPGDRAAVAEAWVDGAEAMARYARPDELHQVFDFGFLQAPWSAPALRAVVDGSLHAVTAVGAPPTWVLSNHDVPRPPTRYGGGEAGRRRALAASLLLLALPGSAYLYQGEELGLPDVDLPDSALRDPVWERSGRTRRGRDGCRVPIPWTAGGPHHGFGDGAPPWLPQPDGWGELAVDVQTGDPSSALELHRSAVALRREHLVPAGEGLEWLPAPDHALAFRRGPVLCQVVTGGPPVQAPAGAPLLLASAPLDDGSVPADTTAWWWAP